MEHTRKTCFLVNVEYKYLLFADDILILAEGAHDLCRLMDVVWAYFDKWRFELSPTKTQQMVFGSTDELCNDPPTDSDEEVVTQTDDYKYLGLLFQRERGLRVQ